MTDLAEFSRRFSLAEIGTSPRRVTVAAEPSECSALAARFGLASLERLDASADLLVVDGVVEANGSMSARLTQTCVATGQPLEASLDAPFQIRFEPPFAGAVDEEIELSAADCDVMEHDGQAIDLGEAVAQTLGLSIDPFPRAANADEVLGAAGVLGEADASPFAKLKGLFGQD